MKALVVDDHGLVREALGRVLQGLAPGATVLEAGDADAAFEALGREPDLDLALLDLTLPGMDGLSVLRRMRAHHPAVAVVIVSAILDRETVQQALDAGAAGYIPKSSSNEVLKSALGVVLAGGVYVPPELLGRHSAQATVTPDVRTAPAALGITERQAEILALMMRGEPNKVICRELDLAESTVKNQVTAILKALKVTSRTQAVLQAGRLGLALPDPKRRQR